MLRRLVPLAMSVALLASCKDKPVPQAAASASAAPSASVERPPEPPFRVERRQAKGRAYQIFVPMAASFQLRLERPAESDDKTVFCVAGTYTSPEDKPEGLILLEGQLVQDTRQKWEGLLLVAGGTARVEKSSESSFETATLEGYAKKHVSLVQGHLLVDAGKPTKLKESPALHRRAIATGSGGWGRHRSYVVESVEPVELATFAADLAALGAQTAMNLDMGAWDEGWYRGKDGKIVRLGHDKSSTKRQSNWLVLWDPHLG